MPKETAVSALVFERGFYLGGGAKSLDVNRQVNRYHVASTIWVDAMAKLPKIELRENTPSRVVGRAVKGGCTTWSVETTTGKFTKMKASPASKASIKKGSEIYAKALRSLAKR